MSKPPAVSISPARQALARAEQVAMVYCLLPGGIGASLGVAVLLAGGLAGQVPQKNLAIWLGCIVLVSGVRLLNLRAWRRNGAPGEIRWIWYFHVGAALGGLTWCVAGFWLFPADSNGQMLMTFALGGIAAGGMSTLGVLRGPIWLFC